MTQQQKASKWWYLMPVFMGFVGGLISFLVLRKEDSRTAQNCLFIGIVVTVTAVAVYIVSLVALFAK